MWPGTVLGVQQSRCGAGYNWRAKQAQLQTINGYIYIILCSSIQRMSICAWAFKFHHDDGLCTLLLVLCVSASLKVATYVAKYWVKL